MFSSPRRATWALCLLAAPALVVPSVAHAADAPLIPPETTVVNDNSTETVVESIDDEEQYLGEQSDGAIFAQKSSFSSGLSSGFGSSGLSSEFGSSGSSDSVDSTCWAPDKPVQQTMLPPWLLCGVHVLYRLGMPSIVIYQMLAVLAPQLNLQPLK
ncbi:hypothetical protein C1Y63_08970 [Corynebacterium sp. 13CS0277]|uniref:hypothetical protein n=1 Tax=Corynebacterium sp. 13CS0277 TaxID=2071994 RepID=UPI000D030DCB|nr:hypothetical protein [Corynebacterium sp. 13CS0277]PRQ10866.1 hypothetical protein C1Y63_08970 [Corynebacterium sp. 13CS0277]